MNDTKKKQNNEREEVAKFIEGERISLIPSSKEHIPLYTKWMNDPEVRKYSRNPVPLSIDEIKKWFEPSDQKYTEFIGFEIYHNDDKRVIGVVGINHINWIYRHANIFITIGEKDYWNQGYATEAARMVLNYAFNEINLNKIYAGIAELNKGSWNVAEKLNFTYETTVPEDFYMDGKYVSVKKYHILKDEWVNREREK